MRFYWTSSTIAVALALACAPKSAESETDVSPSSSSSDATDDTDTGLDPSEGHDTVVTGTVTGGPSETTTATDGMVVTTSATEATETDATETGSPAGCFPPDPSTSAAFKVLLDAWPGQSDDAHSVDRVCTIDAIGVAAPMVVTEVTCDVDGAMLGAKFELAAAPEGQVDWQVGQSVSLRSRAFEDEFGGDVALQVTLADDPAALLVDGRAWWGEAVPQLELIGPIHRDLVMSCVVDVDSTIFELKYSFMSGSVSLWSGHRGSLAIDDSHVYAIDLDHSNEDCCHGSEHSLIRRIKSE